MRHNLSLNSQFIKLPKDPTDPNAGGKGGYWTLDPVVEDILIDKAFKMRGRTGGTSYRYMSSPYSDTRMLTYGESAANLGGPSNATLANSSFDGFSMLGGAGSASPFSLPGASGAWGGLGNAASTDARSPGGGYRLVSTPTAPSKPGGGNGVPEQWPPRRAAREQVRERAAPQIPRVARPVVPTRVPPIIVLPGLVATAAAAASAQRPAGTASAATTRAATATLRDES